MYGGMANNSEAYKIPQKHLIDNSYTSSHPNLQNALFGLLNIYKPAGITSHDVVAVLRKQTGIKQIGHTGTLDPFAEGVLPVCIGKATRLIEYFTDDKEYLATVQFGSATTTYDIEGEITFASENKINEQDILQALKNFEGEIEQLPPIYSAIKVKGKKLYEYARKGEDVKIEPRKVFIEKIEMKNFNFETQQAEILIKCSKGTYIRSIANDLGKNLNVGGHLIKLVRTQAGKCRIEDAVSLDNINIEKDLKNQLELIDLPIINATEEDLKNIKNGVAIKTSKKDMSSLVILVYNDIEICAVGYADSGIIKLKKVFL